MPTLISCFFSLNFWPIDSLTCFGSCILLSILSVNSLFSSMEWDVVHFMMFGVADYLLGGELIGRSVGAVGDMVCLGICWAFCTFQGRVSRSDPNALCEKAVELLRRKPIRSFINASLWFCCILKVLMSFSSPSPLLRGDIGLRFLVDCRLRVGRLSGRSDLTGFSHYSMLTVIFGFKASISTA